MSKEGCCEVWHSSSSTLCTLAVQVADWRACLSSLLRHPVQTDQHTTCSALQELHVSCGQVPRAKPFPLLVVQPLPSQQQLEMPTWPQPQSLWMVGRLLLLKQLTVDPTSKQSLQLATQPCHFSKTTQPPTHLHGSLHQTVRLPPLVSVSGQASAEQLA